MIGGNSAVANGKSLSENVEFTVKPYTTTPPSPQINPLLVVLLIGAAVGVGIIYVKSKGRKGK